MNETLYLWEIKKTTWIKGTQDASVEYVAATRLESVLKYLEKDISDNSVDIETINKLVKIDTIL